MTTRARLQRLTNSPYKLFERGGAVPRPVRDGVTYWTREVGLRRDDKVKLIKAEFGIKGVYIYEEILNAIYEDKGYYKQWDEDACFLMSEGVGDVCTPKLIAEVVRRCVKRSLFDERVFNVFGVLTSAGVQKRYLMIVSKYRKEIPVLKKYWLLNKEDIPDGTFNKLAFIEDKSTDNPDKSTFYPTYNIKLNKTILYDKGIGDTGVSDPSPEIKIIELFNDICKSYPKVIKITPERVEAIKAQMTQYALDDFKKLFCLAEKSAFLKGKNDRGWVATFDWLISGKYMPRVLEGNYNNKPGGKFKAQQLQGAYDIDEFEKISWQIID
jgi:hypothetical protein